MRSSNRGQMRVVEAMIGCVILIIGIYATVYFSSVFTTEEGGDLEEAGQDVLYVLENTALIKQVIQNESNWEPKLKSLLGTLLPLDTFYNLTLISGLTDQTIAVITNMMRQDSSLDLNTVTLKQVVTISLPLEKVEYKELDIMLVIDRSGSMDQKETGDMYNKIYYAKEAAKAFVDQLNPSKHRVGLVSFSDEANLEIGLTNDFQEVKSKVDNLYPSGETNMGDAVKESNEEFFAHNRSSAASVMIFLTDGMANRPCHHSPQHNESCSYAQEYARNETEKAQDRGILIYTIGLGADTSRLDEGLLKEMQTNGYYYAPSAEDLMDVYTAIAQDLLFAVKYDIVLMTLTLVKAG